MDIKIYNSKNKTLEWAKKDSNNSEYFEHHFKSQHGWVPTQIIQIQEEWDENRYLPPEMVSWCENNCKKNYYNAYILVF